MKRYVKANTDNIYYFVDPKGDLYKSYESGFTTYTQDWNYDGDVYEMSVRSVFPICPDDNDWQLITEGSWDECGFNPISPDEAKRLLHDKLENYFMEGDSSGEYYYCDSTDGGKYHYGDYNFMQGGPCVYGTPEDRENAIQQEIQICME